MGPNTTKVERRRALRAARRERVAGRDPVADAHGLAAAALELVDELGLGPGAVVLSYASVPGEPPTGRMNAALEARGMRVLLPITEADLDLDWHDAQDPLSTPLGRDAPSTADLVLAPGLSVDPTGTRMGQGGGCYDRALPRRRPTVPVLVALHPGELLDEGDVPLPRDAHDVPVDGVLTAEGVHRLGGGGRAGGPPD
jgi:5-formyltetrahydrofolate cyclo-ligase